MVGRGERGGRLKKGFLVRIYVITNFAKYLQVMSEIFGNRLDIVSEITVSNTELSEFICPHRAPKRELSLTVSSS